MSTVDLIGARWRTSSFSGGAGSGGDCVEVAFPVSAVAIRDSKDPNTGTLILPNASWGHFLGQLAAELP